MKKTVLIAALALGLGLTTTGAKAGGEVHATAGWTGADEQQMVGLFDKLMTLQRTDNHSWKGIQAHFLPLPPKCEEERHHVAGGTAVRVVCH